MDNPICSKEICTGCSACYNVCPVECIEMIRDEEGFDFPFIDVEKCIDCHKCKDVCPMINPAKFNKSIEHIVYVAWHKEKNVRYKSSSGGSFVALANTVINQDGVVYGAAYNENMIVQHIGVSNTEDIRKLQGSKYVQSDIRNTYSDINSKLIKGKKVLFSGTPCQVAGLKNFIGNNDDNLLTCDILCAGVPSPGLFDKYINFLNKESYQKIQSINFRDKKYGWGIAMTQVKINDGTNYYAKDINNSYMYAFSIGISIRKSCHNCRYTKTDRVGDITLGDFWGIGENENFNHSTNDGVSFVKVNSNKGKELFSNAVTNMELEKRSLKEAEDGQGIAFSKPKVLNSQRENFFKEYVLLDYEELSKKYLVDKGIKGLIKKIIPSFWIYKIRKIIRG